MLPVTQAQPVSKIIRNALSGELAFNPIPAGKNVGTKSLPWQSALPRRTEPKRGCEHRSNHQVANRGIDPWSPWDSNILLLDLETFHRRTTERKPNVCGCCVAGLNRLIYFVSGQGSSICGGRPPVCIRSPS